MLCLNVRPCLKAYSAAVASASFAIAQADNGTVASPMRQGYDGRAEARWRGKECAVWRIGQVARGRA